MTPDEMIKRLNKVKNNLDEMIEAIKQKNWYRAYGSSTVSDYFAVSDAIKPLYHSKCKCERTYITEYGSGYVKSCHDCGRRKKIKIVEVEGS